MNNHTVTAHREPMPQHQEGVNLDPTPDYCQACLEVKETKDGRCKDCQDRIDNLLKDIPWDTQTR